MKKIIGLLLFAAVLLSACKKDDPEPTTAEKLQVKWNLNSIVATDYSTTPPDVITQNFINTLLEFRTNGTLYIQGSGVSDSSTYTILSDRYLIDDGDSVEIVTLNSTTLQLKSIERNLQGAIVYDTKINCSR